MVEQGEGSGFGAVARRIAELRQELERVEGTPTEVYSRIVGYYRSVRNWNAGKRDEYSQRLAFAMPAIGEGTVERRAGAELGDAAPVRIAESASAAVDCAASRPAALLAPDGAVLRNGVLVFTREACPDCSPVANYVMGAGIDAIFVDVDREEGLELARSYGIMATPTVLGLDGEGRESFRAFGVGELRERVEKAAATRPC